MTKEYLKKTSEVDYTVKIPDSELEVMVAIWKAEPPITTNTLMQLIGSRKGWKVPTLISFLTRLEDRGFVMSYKCGKERLYIPIAEKDIYMSNISKLFVNTFYEGSFINLLDSFFKYRNFENSDIDELLLWLKSR